MAKLPGHFSLTLGALATACLLLTACNSGSSSSEVTPPKQVLQGTAAVGAPIVDGTVDVLCATGPALQATTSADGVWEATLGNHTFPCSVRVSGGNAVVSLHSHVPEFAQANITPLTDLILAYATQQTPSEWFDNRSEVSQEDLDAATEAVLDAFRAAGYAVPEGNPLTTPFVIGDDWDQLLDALGDQLDATGDDNAYETLLQTFAQRNVESLPSASADENSQDDQNNEDHEAPAEAQLVADYAGFYMVTGPVDASPEHRRGLIIIGDDGSIDFDDEISLPAASIQAVYDRTFIDGPDRRIHINYGANDSFEGVNIYLDEDLEVISIKYRPNPGGTGYWSTVILQGGPAPQ